MSPLEKYIIRLSRGDEDIAQEARIAAWKASLTHDPARAPLEWRQKKAAKFATINERIRRGREKRTCAGGEVEFDEETMGSQQLDRVDFAQQYPWLKGAMDCV